MASNFSPTRPPWRLRADQLEGTVFLLNSTTAACTALRARRLGAESWAEADSISRAPTRNFPGLILAPSNFRANRETAASPPLRTLSNMDATEAETPGVTAAARQNAASSEPNRLEAKDSVRTAYFPAAAAVAGAVLGTVNRSGARGSLSFTL